MMQTLISSSLKIMIVACILLCGCSSSGKITPEYGDGYRVRSNGAQLPEGVVAYCWEEPMVRYEAQRPGLDYEGHWYNPAHVAVRQVRGGMWRPCNTALSN